MNLKKEKKETFAMRFVTIFHNGSHGIVENMLLIELK